MNSSYGLCELQLGTAGNAAVNQVWQQGATEGISIFVSAGDQGSAGCTDQNTPAPNLTPYGFQVNGLASSPFVTAVGGTDSIWWYQLESAAGTLISTDWNLTNAANQGNAKGYIPEIAWNSTCANPLLLTDFINTTTGEPFPNTEALCQAADGSADFLGLMLIAGGSGGVSACTTIPHPASPHPHWRRPAVRLDIPSPRGRRRSLPRTLIATCRIYRCLLLRGMESQAWISPPAPS